MTKSLLIRVIISYVLLMAGFIIYFWFDGFWDAILCLFIGLVCLLSGLLSGVPKGLLREKLGIKRKKTYLPPLTVKRTMADIKSDVKQFQAVWEELENK